MSVALVVLNEVSEPRSRSREVGSAEDGALRLSRVSAMDTRVAQEVSRNSALEANRAPPGNFALDFPKLVLLG